MQVTPLKKMANVNSFEERVEDPFTEIVKDKVEEKIEDSFGEVVEDSFAEIVEDSFGEVVEDSFEEIIEDSLQSGSEVSSTPNYQSSTLHMEEKKPSLNIDLKKFSNELPFEEKQKIVKDMIKIYVPNFFD